MSVHLFNESIRREIKRVVEYANNNVYDVDDIIDMGINRKKVPGAMPEHLVRGPLGQWICYYIVDHPELRQCHYFSILPDTTGKLPDMQTLDYILKEYGANGTLLEEHIIVDEVTNETTIKIPFG